VVKPEIVCDRQPANIKFALIDSAQGKNTLTGAAEISTQKGTKIHMKYVLKNWFPFSVGN